MCRLERKLIPRAACACAYVKGFNKCLWYGLQPSFAKETTEIVVTNDLPRVADFKVMTNSSPILFEGAKNSLV